MYQSLLALYHTHVMYKMHMNKMHMNTTNKTEHYTKLIFSAKKIKK